LHQGIDRIWNLLEWRNKGCSTNRLLLATAGFHRKKEKAGLSENPRKLAKSIIWEQSRKCIGFKRSHRDESCFMAGAYLMP
jgi:hypothetical protein